MAEQTKEQAAKAAKAGKHMATSRIEHGVVGADGKVVVKVFNMGDPVTADDDTLAVWLKGGAVKLASDE